jgi:glycosyltransferase involved in cell wall biosynthesis
MINLVFDLSVIGRAEGNLLGRTGIYRVVHSLASQLIKHPDVSLTWSTLATQSNRATARAIAQTPLDQAPLFQYGRFYNFLGSCEERIRTLDRFSGEKIPGLRFAAATLEHKQVAIESKHLHAPAGTNVWHSTYLPFPSSLKDSGEFARCFTLYDLIPLKFPKFFRGLIPPVIPELVKSFRKEDWIICISESTKRDLLEERPDLDPNHLRVTHLAVEPTCSVDDASTAAAEQKLREAIALPPETPYFLSVCTLEPRKNLLSVIQAFQRVAEAHTTVRLVLVGGLGWDHGALDRALDADTTGRILTTGYLPDQTLPALYRYSTAFVYMSHYEGFGLPVLEAMQNGAPVICSNNSSLPEVAGNAAIQLPPTDIDGITEAMQQLLLHPEVADQYRTLGRERARQFSWTKCANETVAVYREAMR